MGMGLRPEDGACGMVQGHQNIMKHPLLSEEQPDSLQEQVNREMAEPQLEINDAAPTSLAHLIGQRNVVQQVKVALDAARHDQKKFDSALLCGPPGTGKTQTAKVTAQEMGTEYHEVLGQAITCPADFNALLLGAKERDVVLIDEAHELDREYQTALYMALDQRRVFLQSGKTGRTPQSIPLADFSLL